VTRISAKDEQEATVNHSVEKVDPLSDEDGLALEANGEGIELVFGLVGPTGVDLGKVYESLKNQLKAVNYEAVMIRLSELITPYLKNATGTFATEYDRISTLMENGTKLRELTEQPDVVARLGVAQIRAVREKRTSSKRKPSPRTAYIVSSFKRQEEVALFRQIYGRAFTLISVYSPRQSRIDELARKLRPSVPAGTPSAEELAIQLVRRDFLQEDRKLGQRLGKTFPLADYFVSIDPRSALDEHLLRLVRLTFGDPYISPTRDEQAMFFAQAAALRSLDLSRQVGAAIVTSDGDVLSTGCNEVPKSGGGMYWGEDDNKYRDYEMGHDSNVAIKAEILEDVLARMREPGSLEQNTSGSTDSKKSSWLSDSALAKTNKALVEDALFSSKPFLNGSLLFDVIEFGRAVHAEAAAITDAARRGVKTEGSRLFCTTFPCHICARHIVSSGIHEVVFIEPYEKSRTSELYRDSVSVEPTEPSSTKANFRAFVGVAPRAYMESFQMTSDRKKRDGKILDMDEIADKPKTRRIVLTYLLIEGIVIRETKRSPEAKETPDE
jgi:deoxycytidylate deaminase